MIPAPKPSRLSPCLSPHLLALAAALVACTPRSRPAEDTPTPIPTPTPTPEAAEATTTGAAAPEVAPTPPPLTRHDPRPRTLAVGGPHVCALAGQGQVACWGAGREGQLGPGVVDHKAAPSLVTGLEDAVALLASRTASCALRADRALSCWGKIDRGSPGLRTTRALGEIVELTMSDYFDPRVCARRSDGSVACVALADLADGTAKDIPGVSDAVGLEIDGRELHILRASGELVMTTLDRDVIVAPTPAMPELVVDLARVHGRVCVLLQSGEMRCRSYPATWKAEVPVAGPLWKAKIPGDLWGSAVDYESQGGVSCARDGDGVVSCWGDNTYGQLGLGTPAFSMQPRRVLPGTATAVSAGGEASCGVFGDGELRCFEHALYDDEVAVEGVRAVALSSGHACAIVGGGEARCWGYSDTGALGTTGSPDDAVRVPGLSNLLFISVGDDHSCAVRRDQTVRCWGSGAGGQLGDGRSQEDEEDGDHGDDDGEAPSEPHMSATPLVVDGLPGEITGLALAADYSCVGSRGGLHCWGTIPEPPEIEDAVITKPRQFLATPVAAVDAEDDSLCALDGEGGLHCWGSVANNYRDGEYVKLEHGDDGDDGEDEHEDYPEIDEGDDAEPFRLGGPLWRLGALPFAPTGIAVGSEHACLLAASGEVHCWGANDQGQLGDGTTHDRSVPVKVKGLPGPAKEIAAGSSHTCARVEGGGMYCWGSKTSAKEFGRQSAPTVVKGLAPFKRVGGAAASGSPAPTPTPTPSKP